MTLIKTILLEKERINEKIIRKKARGYSLVIFILLMMTLLLPFCNEPLEKEDPLFEKAILVQFDEEDFKQMASAEKSSSRAAANAPASESEEETEQEEKPAATPEPVETETPNPKPEKVSPPTTDPVPIRPSQDRPILTAPEPAEINIEEMLQEIPEEAQVEEVSEEVTEVTEEVSADFMAELADYFKTNSSDKPSTSSSSSSGSSTGGNGTANNDKPDTGNSSTAGEGNSGKSETGDSKTDGQGNSGTSGNDFEGDGLLTRKVIKRANLDKIIKKNGKIVINLCVNRDGIVIFARADKSGSSIKDPLLLKKAERAASRYRYEKDYTVAERQCGKLTVIIKGLD